MTLPKSLLLLLGCFLLAVHCQEELSDALELTLDTFQTTLDGHPLVMVMFYAPWCGACKKFAPEFDTAATLLKGTAVLAKINAWEEHHAELNKQWNATSYPTVWIVREGERAEYDGDLDVDSVVRTLKRKARPAFEVIQAASTEDFVARDPSTVSVIGFFQQESGPEFDSFVQAARKLRDVFAFGLVVGTTELNADSPVVSVHKNFDERVARIEGATLLDLERTLLLHRFPLFNEINKDNSRDYINARAPLAFVFVESAEQRSALEDILRPVAIRVQADLYFLFIDWTKYGSQAEKLGLTGGRAPAIAIDDTQRRIHYAFDETQEITTAAVDAWVSQVLGGQLRPTMRSEPIPTSQEGAVVKIVQATFDELVRDSTKDVFLEIYAPWCGHCKTLKPVWDQLATALQDVPTIRVAAIDGTANDLEPGLLNGFPALLFYPADQKQKPIAFTGKTRSYEALLEFAMENARFKFSATQLKDEL
eukprot:TRINITY_DN26579_c0_g1_i1.p1 TRINITY_DN26579_c0_g1~~TRINITY_DN26579_c0_g1_i1.p1  ORF type:complete len:479 (+),score=50.65 TRINITY_DN26579_c0_g1_i1:91-1527(+)